MESSQQKNKVVTSPLIRLSISWGSHVALESAPAKVEERQGRNQRIRLRTYPRPGGKKWCPKSDPKKNGNGWNFG